MLYKSLVLAGVIMQASALPVVIEDRLESALMKLLDARLGTALDKLLGGHLEEPVRARSLAASLGEAAIWSFRGARSSLHPCVFAGDEHDCHQPDLRPSLASSWMP